MVSVSPHRRCERESINIVAASDLTRQETARPNSAATLGHKRILADHTTSLALLPSAHFTSTSPRHSDFCHTQVLRQLELYLALSIRYITIPTDLKQDASSSAHQRQYRLRRCHDCARRMPCQRLYLEINGHVHLRKECCQYVLAGREAKAHCKESGGGQAEEGEDRSKVGRDRRQLMSEGREQGYEDMKHKKTLHSELIWIKHRRCWKEA